MANEKRLIDANALVDGIEKRYCKPCEEKHEDYNHIRCRACWVDDMVDGIEKRYCKPCEEKHEDYNHIRCRACWVDDMVGELESAPTVDAVEVVHGRWIPLEYDGYADGNPVWDLWECSECQEEHSGDEDTLTPYCPNCGAKMDGDGNA